MSVFMGCAPAEKPTAHTIPQAWLPDAAVDAEPLPEETEQLAAEVEQTFSVVAESLENIPVPAPAKDAPWSLSKMTFHLGVGASGIFGVLFGDGDGAVDIAWGRKESPKAAPTPEPKAEDQSPKISVASDASVASLEAQVEPFVRAALASREIQNETMLRRSLRTQLLRFKDMVVILSRNPGKQGRWALQSLDLALVFSASGEIPAGPGIKAALTIALHWDLTPSAEPARPRADLETEFGKNLEAKLQRITSDLSGLLDLAITQVNQQNSAFALTDITLNLGFSKSGDVGIASVAGDLTGAFNYEVTDRNAAAYAAVERRIPILIATPERKSTGTNRAERKSVYAPAATFAKGLGKAFKVARFFANRAESVSGSAWEVKSIVTDFSVTRSAKVGLVTIDASSGVTLTFKRRKKLLTSIAAWPTGINPVFPRTAMAKGLSNGVLNPVVPTKVAFSPYFHSSSESDFSGISPQISRSLSDYLAREASNPDVLNAVACVQAPKTGWNLGWVLLGIKSQLSLSAFKVAKVSVAPKIQWIWEPVSH